MTDPIGKAPEQGKLLAVTVLTLLERDGGDALMAYENNALLPLRMYRHGAIFIVEKKSAADGRVSRIGVYAGNAGLVFRWRPDSELFSLSPRCNAASQDFTLVWLKPPLGWFDEVMFTLLPALIQHLRE